MLNNEAFAEEEWPGIFLWPLMINVDVQGAWDFGMELKMELKMSRRRARAHTASRRQNLIVVVIQLVV